VADSKEPTPSAEQQASLQPGVTFPVRIDGNEFIIDCGVSLTENIVRYLADHPAEDPPSTYCLKQANGEAGGYLSFDDPLAEQLETLEESQRNFRIVKKPSILADEAVNILSSSLDEAKLKKTVFKLHKERLLVCKSEHLSVDHHMADRILISPKNSSKRAVCVSTFAFEHVDAVSGVQALIRAVEHSFGNTQSYALLALNGALGYVSGQFILGLGAMTQNDAGMNVVLETPGLIEAFFNLVSSDSHQVRKHALATLFVLTTIAHDVRCQTFDGIFDLGWFFDTLGLPHRAPRCQSGCQARWRGTVCMRCSNARGSRP